MFARVIGLPPDMQSSSFSSMEIRELAERILFGTTLEEKLVRVDRLQDTQPGKALTTPDKPGRPAELALDRWGVTERVPFADVRALEGDEDRGLVLHFFANHELLAAELMALVLLKFPDAPARFRRGVAQTMKDEQEHVRLYLDRMQDAGVTFGQIPVSDFFWRAIAPMPSPMDFVTCLSLTLEQANLDYAPHYQQLFGELGDADTAALLGRIYKDEIGHVKHGLNWFNTWRSPTQSEWASFQAALGFPLSPSRAKGIGFNREGRRQAGFSAEFIDELDIFAHSHGRCPDLYWFNPLCDLAAGRDALFTPNSALIDVAHDLAMVSALLAANDDIVVIPQRPSVGFMQRWKQAGLPMPQLVEWDPMLAVTAADHTTSPPPAVADRRLTTLRPWGWAPDSVQALQPLAGQLPEGQPTPLQQWSPERRDLYRKSWSVGWLEEISDSLRAEEGGWIGDRHTVGTVCHDAGMVEDALKRGFASGWVGAVMKADFGTAGGQLMKVDAREDATSTPLLDHQQGWLRGQLRDAGAIVVEPWLDRVLDLSAQYDVQADCTIRLVGISRFLTDERGRFQGIFVSNMVGDLDPDVRRFLYGDGQDTHRLQRLFGHLGDLLLPRLPDDFQGPIGVDAMVYREAGALRMKPIVEVNPRFTMGRVGLSLRKRVLTSRTAVWRVQRLRDLADDVETWAARLSAARPLEMTADGHQISMGAVFTNEPTEARVSVGVLMVAEQADPQMLTGETGAPT